MKIKIKQLGRDWSWPAEDRDCRAVVFDWAADLDQVYQHLPSFRNVIQAGGNMGVWPWLMAQRFHHVYTFEPDPRLFGYLCENVPETNVFKYQAALGNKRRMVQMVNDLHERNNLGAQFVDPEAEGNIPTVRVDDFRIPDVDLIYLDIEGMELQALYGAYMTIRDNLPVIVVEDKGLSVKYGSAQGDIERWLWHEFKYEVAQRVHRDVILVPPKAA